MADGFSVSERATAEMLEYVRKYRKKLDLLEFEPSFGRQVGLGVKCEVKAVVNAFLFPAVDTSLEPFSWGSVKMDLLSEFCGRRSGVDFERIRRMVDPAIRNQERSSQLQ